MIGQRYIARWYWVSKTQLARLIWPQSAVLQKCYSRNICLGPTLYAEVVLTVDFLLMVLLFLLFYVFILCGKGCIQQKSLDLLKENRELLLWPNDFRLLYRTLELWSRMSLLLNDYFACMLCSRSWRQRFISCSWKIKPGNLKAYIGFPRFLQVIPDQMKIPTWP